MLCIHQYFIGYIPQQLLAVREQAGYAGVKVKSAAPKLADSVCFG